MDVSIQRGMQKRLEILECFLIKFLINFSYLSSPPSFLFSFHKYLLSPSYDLGTVPGLGKTAVTKTRCPTLWSLYSGRRKR